MKILLYLFGVVLAVLIIFGGVNGLKLQEDALICVKSKHTILHPTMEENFIITKTGARLDVMPSVMQQKSVEESSSDFTSIKDGQCYIGNIQGYEVPELGLFKNLVHFTEAH